jgi:hypothetical protein
MPRYDEDSSFGDPYADERYGGSRREEHDDFYHRSSHDARGRSRRDRELSPESRENEYEGHQSDRKGRERATGRENSPLELVGGYWDDPNKYKRELPAKSSDGSRRRETAENQVLFETGRNWDVSGGNYQAQQDVKDDGCISLRDFEEERSRRSGQGQSSGGKASEPGEKGKQWPR